MKPGTIYAASAGVSAAVSATSAKLGLSGEWEMRIAALFLVIALLGTIIMWSLYFRALACFESTTTPLMINMGCNFAMTGILGEIIFKESHSLTWWALLALLIAGLALLNSDNSTEPRKELKVLD